MCLEIPVSAFALAKFPNPEPNLSAFAGLLVAICFFFESPILNLLGSSAALVRTKEDLRILHKLLSILCAVIAAIFSLLVLSPFAKFVIIPLFGSTEELYTLAFPALTIGITWPFLVGYRRVNQGLFVYIGKSKLVGLTSISRILTLIVSLYCCYYLELHLNGITIVSACMTFAVFVEALLSKLLLEKYAKPRLTNAKSELTLKSTWHYCFPLILSSIMSHLVMPLGAAILFRLPQSTLSLVIWPALSGLISILRTPGSSLIELVASCGESAENRSNLLKFANKISTILFLLLVVFALTGWAQSYFVFVGGLGIEQAQFASTALVFGLLYPVIDTRLWYLTGCAYALKKTKVAAHATAVGVSVGICMYSIGVNQTHFSGAAFLLILLTIYTLAEVAVFSRKLSAKF